MSVPPLPPYLGFDAAARSVRLDPREPDFVQDPYAAYAFLHAACPVFFWEEYGLWCLTRFDDVNAAFRNRKLGRARPGGYLANVNAAGDRSHLADFDRVEAHSLLEVEPPVHTRLRTLVNRAFVSRQVERLRPLIEALAHRLIDGFEHEGSTELIERFATPLPATIITEMMGLPAESAPQLVAWSNDMVRMYTLAPDGRAQACANRSAASFADFIRDHARRLDDTKRDTLLGVLTTASEEGEKLNEAELVSSAILLLNAGHEATVHQTGNAVRAILKQGGDPHRFFKDVNTTTATVEECLRWDAPLHMFTRHIYEEVEITNDLKLKPGQQVALLLGAANRDPLAFEDADRFRPGRSDQKNVSFGAGIHFCIGAPLARLELQVALRVLFERLPDLRLAGEPRYRDSYHFHGLERLDVEW